MAEIEQKGLRRVIIHTEVPDRREYARDRSLSGETLAEDVYLGPHADSETLERHDRRLSCSSVRRKMPETLTAGTELTEKHIKKMQRSRHLTMVKVRKASLVPYRGQLQVQPGQT